MKMLSLGLLAFGLVLGSLAAWQLPSVGRVGQGDLPLVAKLTRGELGNLGLGSHEIDCEIENPGTSPKRILGANVGCCTGFCITVAEGAPATVLPGQKVHVKLQLELREPGPYEFKLEIYLEEKSGIRTVELPLSWNAQGSASISP